MRVIPSALLALAIALPAAAQQLDLPKPSPSAKVTQTAGITDITVEYSSPAVRGREIWGKVVPYGQVWRAGANAATKVTFSRDVTIGGTNIPAASYAFFVIPKQSGAWTLILSKNPNQPGAFAYKQDEDAVRVEVTPEAIPNRERLAYIISNFTEDTASLDLEWEKVRLSLPITLHTGEQVAANIQTIENGAWEPYAAAAGYYRQVPKDYAKAMAFADKSIALKKTWRNLWEKAQVFAAKGEKKEAKKYAKEAQGLAKDAPKFFQDELAKALAEW